MGTTCSSLLCFQRRPKPSTVCINDIASYPAEQMPETIHDPPVEPIPVARYTGRAPYFNLFAVIIGIDRYAHCSALRGAVADATAVREYLQKAFGIPKDHILTLLDGQATRAAIIQAFQNLRNDRRIAKGDPILIYFAGHGSELSAPTAWHIDDQIQSILPYDCEKSRAPTGILPIPDRTIGALIDDIAGKKGDNIVVIFDCCFAAGGTRDENEEYIPRIELLDPNILVEVDDLDQDILEARLGALPKAFSGQGLRSHVLMAASGEAELAYERRGRGLFTMALLEILEESVVNEITYVAAIKRIALDRQSPRCIGLNKERVIFDTRVPLRRTILYPVEFDSPGSLKIGAGQAHGVSHGVEFTLYDQRKTRLGTIKVNRAAEVGDFHTKVAMPEVHIGKRALFVALTRVGQVPFHLGHGWNSSQMATKTRQQILANERSFKFVNDPEGARLEVAVENSRVVFKILDQRTKRLGLTELSKTTTLDNIDRILRAAAKYHWYLHHSHPANKHKMVTVEFCMLKEKLDEDLQIYRVPADGSRLCRKDSVDGLDVIDFVVTPETYYGIKIKNNMPIDLYLNAFLFNSDLSIVPYRIQSSTGNPEAPLKQNGSLTIGYGSSGGRPFEYWLAEDQEVDVGYLKLFFATKPIDLTDVQQDSPFDDPGKTEGSLEARLGRPVVEVGDPQDIWFTKMIPIVQRRRGD